MKPLQIKADHNNRNGGLKNDQELSEKENATEKLKAESQMERVGRMNNIHNRATEIVNAEVIYA